jgi:hypothetical protein
MAAFVLTPIHRALGIAASELSEQLIDQAIAAHVVETDDLDWKEGLPNSKDPHWFVELSKDIAAMANSRGGHIVYGVREDGVSNAAVLRTNVDIGAGAQQRLMQAIHAHIRPLIVGVQLFAVECATDLGKGLWSSRFRLVRMHPIKLGRTGHPTSRSLTEMDRTRISCASTRSHVHIETARSVRPSM